MGLKERLRWRRSAIELKDCFCSLVSFTSLTWKICYRIESFRKKVNANKAFASVKICYRIESIARRMTADLVNPAF